MADRHAPARRPAALLPVAAVLTGLFALAACGDGGASAPPADDRGGSTPVATETALSPLANFLGWSEGPGSAGPSDQERRQERLVQELVARCMRTQGFRYVPEEPFQGASGGETGPFTLSPAEFASQYGYGITTIDAGDVAGPEVDPNQEILDGLSPEAREAYTLALYGEAGARPLPGWIEPLPGAAPPDGQDGAADEEGGCYQDAQDEVYGPRGAEPETGLAAAFAQLNAELTALQERIGRDPRVEAAGAAWTDCMADAGHPQYTRPDDPRQVIRDRFTQLTGLNGAPLDGEAPSSAGSAELRALRDHELAVAQADLACRGTYDQVVTEVRVELEQEFIADHRDLLERYRDLAAVTGGDG